MQIRLDPLTISTRRLRDTAMLKPSWRYLRLWPQTTHICSHQARPCAS